MTKSIEILLNEVRYGERLASRTARLYRNVNTIGTFLSVVAGSATLSALTSAVPGWVSVTGAVCFTLFGASMLAVRPSEKAVANDAECKRYARLRTLAASMSSEQLQAALDATREADIPEIESLRDVAFNDVVREAGRSDHVVQLRPMQRLLASLA